MKKLTLINILLFTSIVVFSQTITVNQTSLSFGNVFENAPDSMQITILNNTGKAVNVTGIQFYNVYGNKSFSVRDSIFSITNGGSKNIWVIFKPVHNIFYNSEMIMLNDSKRGYLSVDLRGQGKYSKTYYGATENNTEETLKSILKSIITSGYNQLSYNSARDHMFMFLDNKKMNGQGASQNTLECVYTGRNAVGYTSRTDAQNNHNFNTEHTFPQSLFSSILPMKSDLHHLFPTDVTANTQRGSYPFGVVSNPSWQNGGSKLGSNIFEPRDIQKGSTARAMFYFVLRYQNYNNFLNSQESILRQWHKGYPPSARDIKRNNGIDSLQYNRNPFVDYPQLIDRITSLSSLSVAPIIKSYNLPEQQIRYVTVNPGTSNIYNFVIVNDGNQNINFSNFILTNTAILGFEPGSGNDTLLEPGEALCLLINLNTSNNYPVNEYLIFTSDVNGSTFDSIPVTANNGIGIVEKNTNNIQLKLYPNPVTDYCIVAFNQETLLENCKVYIVDESGKRIKSFVKLIGNNKLYIETKSLSKGVYFVFMSNFVIKGTSNVVDNYAIKLLK